jgi:hypothetical protein
MRLDTAAPPAPDPVTAAYFRAIEWTAHADAETGSPSQSAADIAEVNAFVAALADAGIVRPQPARALLEGGRANGPRRPAFHQFLLDARERDAAAFAALAEELGYLSNVVSAGCAVQDRALGAQEASNAVSAICNLGLESWPAQWATAQSLVPAFQVGWAVLHNRVCMRAANRLIATLAADWADFDTARDVERLRIDMERHCRQGEPWKSRAALDVLMLLDVTSWAVIVGLIAELPVLHPAAALQHGSRTLSVSADAFEFIAENRQLMLIDRFLDTLPDTLLPPW